MRLGKVGKNTQNYKKGLNDPDYRGGAVTHLEPNILECEVKWALGSITMSKASGVMKLWVHLVKAMVFPLVMDGCENLDHKEG